jgi:hypothetical protein
MGKKQRINNITFPSCAALKKHITEKIIPCKDINMNKHTEHFKFLVELLKNHESYERKKAEGTIKNLKSVYFDSKNMMICTWDDGTVTHGVSWNKCLGRKKGTVNNKFNSAMRMAVYKDQTLQFKKNEWENNKCLMCNICEIKTEEEDEAFSELWHVDHHPMQFDDIQKEFLKITSHKIPTEFKDYGDGSRLKHCKVFKNENDPFVIDWIKFHKKKARYQILCRSCNCSKGSNNKLN